MQQHERADFGRLVTDVHAYYKQACSRFVLDLWWATFQSNELEIVQKAMTAHAQDPERGQFCPKVADIIRIVAGTTTDRAALAWGKAYEAMGSVGAYQDVVFDDPAIHAAIDDLGGWCKVCRGEAAELSYLQHRFCQSYRAYVGRGQYEYPRRLMGDRSPDSEYEKKGLPLPRPVLIGAPDRCKSVYEGGSATGKTQITFGRWNSGGELLGMA